jgi:uncharacterized protein GlcG (DUF336 family)
MENKNSEKALTYLKSETNFDEKIEKVIAYLKAETYFEKDNLYRIIDEAEQKAQEMNVPVTICITDMSGHPRMFYHMPEANIVSITLAQKKANTAIMMRKPTKDLNKDTVPNGELYQIETMLNGEIVTFAGGIPLVCNGQVIGAIGISGGSVEEDQLICELSVKTFFEGE